MSRYAVRQRIFRALELPASLTSLATATGVTDARLRWHLARLREAGLVFSTDGVWMRTPQSEAELSSVDAGWPGIAFPQRIIDDFEDAVMEQADGLYGPETVQARGEHRGRLSREQASEFHDRLLHLIAEYFAPGQGDRSGIKHGFHWILTPIDLHPLADDEPAEPEHCTPQ